jgi:TP53 regulating kinase-like protein
MKVVAEGAEAIVYDTELDGIKAFMKRRIQKKYRIEAMDTRIRTKRSRNEAKIIAIVSKAGINAPKLIMFDGYDIYMSPVNGRKLAEISGSLALFGKVGAMLGKLHNAGVVHGDYTPANIIVDNGDPYVIDFGLSEMTNAAEEKAFDVLLMKRSAAKASYLRFLEGYKSESSDAKVVLERLVIVEKRGRYQSRTLT